MLIGLTGYAQNGKSTAARVLVDDYGFMQVGFADALKELSYRVNPTIPGIGPLHRVVDVQGWEEAKRYPYVRRFLQELGTQARDILGPDVWVMALSRTLRDPDLQGQDVVISDVRFPNEAEFVHGYYDYGYGHIPGRLWRVDRPDFDNGLGTDHPSERYIPDLPEDVTLTNDSTLEDFESAVRYEVNHFRTGLMSRG